MCVAQRDEIALNVLAYLHEHAAARDTFEGIVEWWLLEQRLKHDAAEVRAVLDDLAAKKLILAYKTADSRIHYRVNPRKEKELLALLKG